MVQNLTLHYFPALKHNKDTDLLPYLRHSQAASAYDAVWALSRAWHTAMPVLLRQYRICSTFDAIERRNIVAEVLNRTVNGTLDRILRDGNYKYEPHPFQGVSVS